VAGQEVTTHLAIGTLRVSFQRAFKLAADSPPTRVRSFGALPVAVGTRGAALVPVADDESVWIGFETTRDRPAALRLRIDEAGSDPVSGQPVTDLFEGMPQNYVVVPPQQSLGGATVRETCARQFVRRAESDRQLAVTTFQFFVVGLQDAGPRRPDRSGGGARRAVGPPGRSRAGERPVDCRLPGHLEQEICVDPHGLAAWNLSDVSHAAVRLVSGDEYARVTGLPAPPPIDQESTYRGWRLP